MKKIPGTEIEIPWFRALHLMTGAGLRASGWRWETLRPGTRPIGIWRCGNAAPGARRFVMVPGFGDSSVSWMSLLFALRPILLSTGQYDEIAVLDFPGFGGFLADARPYDSMDGLRDDTLAVLRELRPTALAGHSLGGWLTAEFALRAPMGVDAPGPETLILLSPSGVFPSDESKKAWRDRFRKGALEGFKEFRPHLFANEPPWFRMIATEFGQFIAKPEIHEFMRSVRDDHFVQGRLSTLRARTWLIWGKQDTLVEPAMAHAWLDELAAAGLGSAAFLLDQVGHSPHIEGVGRTIALVAAMLGGMDLAAVSRLQHLGGIEILESALGSAPFYAKAA